MRWVWVALCWTTMFLSWSWLGYSNVQADEPVCGKMHDCVSGVIRTVEVCCRRDVECTMFGMRLGMFVPTPQRRHGFVDCGDNTCVTHINVLSFSNPTTCPPPPNLKEQKLCVTRKEEESTLESSVWRIVCDQETNTLSRVCVADQNRDSTEAQPREPTLQDFVGCGGNYCVPGRLDLYPKFSEIQRVTASCKQLKSKRSEPGTSNH